jgi:aspartate aminotransferase
VPTTAERGWPLLPEELDRVCRDDPTRPRLVILNYPSNPTGQTYSPEALEELATVARRYRVILLSDEIYGEIDHSGQHQSIARYYPEGTIISSGLSKWSGAGGWRLGTFTFPASLRWLLDAMAVVASETFTSTSAPIQYAAVRAFQGGIEIERYLFESRRILRELGQAMTKRLRAAGLFVPEPQGAFYLFPDFGPLRARLAERGVTNSEELCEQLLEDTGVACLPGSSFGRPPEELTARLAYVDFDGARALVAAQGVAADTGLGEGFLRSFCGNLMDATDRICDWLED